MARNANSRRRLRTMSGDALRFIQQWMDAVDAGLTMGEFCTLQEMKTNTAYGWRHRLAIRGLRLPMLDGMRDQPLRVAGKTRRVAIENTEPADPGVDVCVSGNRMVTFQFVA